jgi:hypothetical protein
MKKRGHLDDLGIDGRVILMDFKELRCEGVDWIHVAETRDQ